MSVRTNPNMPAMRDPADVVRTASFSIALDRDALQEMTRAATNGATDERIPITFSSEFGVERYNYWEDERYLEILDHSAGSIDLSRAQNGLVFVDTHDIYSVQSVLGRVEDVKLRADGKLAGMLKFSQRQAAQDYRRDILDNLAGEVSVGYRIDPKRVDRVTKEGELPRYIVRWWMPTEVSAVPVPADPTVGANRAQPHDDASRYLPVPFLQSAPVVPAAGVPPTTFRTDAPTGGDTTVTQKNTAPNTGANDEGSTESGNTAGVVVTRSEGPTDAERRRTLASLAAQHDVSDVYARGDSAGKSFDEIAADIMATLRARAERGPEFGGRVTLTESEQKRYSVSRAILAASGDNPSGFEVDISQELSKRLPQGYSAKGSGIYIPTNLASPFPAQNSRAAIVAGTSSLGGALTFIEPGSFIDYLRNRAMVLQAGATLLPGLRSSVSFPKQLTTGSVSWVGENPGSDVTETNMTFGLVSLTPKTMQATQAFSRQLLVQAEFVPNIEQLVRGDLASLHALAIDQVAVNGLGSSNQPLGVMKSTNVGTVAIGAQGGVPTYDFLVDQEVQIRSGNIDGEIAYLTTPGIGGKLKKTQKFSSTNGEAVWTGDLLNGRLNGAPAFATNQVPSNLTKGTTSTVCHGIIAGAWQNMWIAEFGMAEIITDVFSKKKQGLIEVTSYQMIDVGIRYDAAFSLILDAKTS